MDSASGESDARTLMRLHVETLFTQDRAGRLLAVNEPGGGPAPRFFLGRTADGNAWWFRRDVAADLADELAAGCASLPADPGIEADPDAAAAFIARLARAEPVRRTWAGPAFRFPADLSDAALAVRVTPDNATILNPYLAAWRADVSTGIPMTVALADGVAVSVCGSVRASAHAHEAGVETYADFRGRGYAARAVSAWARCVREMDRIPLYSTSWENRPSRALARKLGLIQYGATLHIT